jgi:hypothetical protein
MSATHRTEPTAVPISGMYSRRPWTRLGGDPSFLALCRDFYNRQSGGQDLFLLVVGGGLSLLGWWYRPIQGDAGVRWIFALTFFVMLGGGLRSLFGALRAKLAFRRGRPALAEVTVLRDVTRTRVGVNALVNGWAEGVRLVKTESTSFHDTFATDEPGSSGVDVGSVMRVLVDPRELRVLAELGVEPPHTSAQAKG